MDLVTNLREALDEDERVARTAASARSVVTAVGSMLGEPMDPNVDWLNDAAALRAHIARHDPARVLRQVAAMRKMLDEHKESTVRGGWERDDIICGTCSYDSGLDDYSYPCPTVLALAEALGIEP